MRSAKIILNQDVHTLGEEGDVKQVAPGYARNFLIPQKLAVPFTKANMALFGQRRAAIEKRKDEKRDAAMSLREKIEAIKIVIDMPAGDSGKLFGSVTNAAIADRLMAEGVAIDRKKIEIPEHHIKMTGTYTVKVKLYADQAANVAVEVRPEASAKSVAADGAEKRRRQRAEEAARAEESAEADSAVQEDEDEDDAGESD